MLIVSVLVVYRQISYVQNKNLGFKKDNVIYFAKEGKIAENTDAFLAEVKKIPGIVNASGIMQSIVGSQGGTVGMEWEGKNPKESIRFNNITVDYGAIETLGMHLKEGRAFAKQFGADSTNIIFNEAAIKAMGLQHPIGKIVKLWGQNRQIVGVVNDFNFESLHDEVKPVFLKLEPAETMTIMASIESGKEREAIDKLQQVYQTFNPGYSLEYKFLDQDFQAQYVSEQRISILSRYFAGLAILISCLGLFWFGRVHRRTAKQGNRYPQSPGRIGAGHHRSSFQRLYPVGRGRHRHCLTCCRLRHEQMVAGLCLSG